MMLIKINRNHFIILFPMRSAADLRVFLKVLSYRMPAFLRVTNAIGNLYDIGFSLQDDKTLLLSGHSESDIDELMEKLVKYAGTLFDALFRHVQHPPAMPVSRNAADFAKWIRKHRVTSPYRVAGNLN
jgi:hypothetical protein